MVRLADVRRPREGISLMRFLEQVAPDERTAEAWFVVRRWPDGVRCAHCDSTRIDVPSRIGAMTADVTFP
ncbi:MAG: hypothetical protein OXG05_16075 [Gammaproteobacteria bacterium]|nr:hypothetical protein [Gammaproteobacteria bacterium]